MIGVKTPLVMSSRSDSALTKLYTMALSVVLAGSEDMKKATERDLTIVVNPGSTSTKLAVYRGEQCLACETIDHKKEDLARLCLRGRSIRVSPRRGHAISRGARRRRGAMCAGCRPRRHLEVDARRRVPRQRPDAPRVAGEPMGRAPLQPRCPAGARNRQGHRGGRRSSSIRRWWTRCGRWPAIPAIPHSCGRADFTPFRSVPPLGGPPAS